MSREEPLYGIQLSLRSTGALTFRRMPSAILHISTYPFIPPTTLSGWLRRLCLISQGVYPDVEVKNPDYFVMPESYHVLGAYPADQRQAKEEIHTTKRQGIRAFNHGAFSRLSGGRTNKEVYQLHTWEYLMTERFSGFVAHTQPDYLEGIRELVNFGCKCGKEGYVYLDEVSAVHPLTHTRLVAMPSTPTTGSDLLAMTADLTICYRHEYKAKQPLSDNPFDTQPSQVEGFQSVWLGWPSTPVELDYFTDGGSWYIPASMLEVF